MSLVSVFRRWEGWDVAAAPIGGIGATAQPYGGPFSARYGSTLRRPHMERLAADCVDGKTYDRVDGAAGGACNLSSSPRLQCVMARWAAFPRPWAMVGLYSYVFLHVVYVIFADRLSRWNWCTIDARVNAPEKLDNRYQSMARSNC
jgi:hypothetical protein